MFLQKVAWESNTFFLLKLPEQPEFLSDCNKKHNYLFLPAYRCYNFMWNLVRIDFMASEEMSFESWPDDGCLPIL